MSINKKILYKIADETEYFYDRWQDEQGLEDFSDYVKSMEKIINAKEQEFLGLTQNPFKVSYIDSKTQKTVVLKPDATGISVIVK